MTFKSTYGYEITDASGNMGVSPWMKMGFNDAVNGATAEILAPQGGAYVFPTAGAHMHVVSSSAEDDPEKADTNAGTGIWTLTIYYLDSTYAEKTETVTLNGTTSVETTATDIFRINNVRATTTGTSYAAVGNISIKNHAETITYGYIAATNTRQRQFVYTVPAGYNLYIAAANVYCIHTAANKRCIITLRATYDEKLKSRLTAGLLFMPYAEAVLSDNPIPAQYDIPKKFPEKTDIKIEAISNGTATVAIAMNGCLKKS